MINIYDAIKERENQISIMQAEIEALRVAIRILEAGSIVGSQTIPAVDSQTIPAVDSQPIPAAILQAANNPGAEKVEVWP